MVGLLYSPLSPVACYRWYGLRVLSSDNEVSFFFFCSHPQELLKLHVITQSKRALDLESWQMLYVDAIS